MDLERMDNPDDDALDETQKIEPLRHQMLETDLHADDPILEETQPIEPLSRRCYEFDKPSWTRAEPEDVIVAWGQSYKRLFAAMRKAVEGDEYGR